MGLLYSGYSGLHVVRPRVGCAVATLYGTPPAPQETDRLRQFATRHLEDVT